MIFPRVEETRSALENISISKRDVATQCFLDLVTWLRVIILQDAVFLRKQFPSLSLWMHSPFNHSAFEEFSDNLLHEASFGEDPKYVQVAKAMPKVAQLMQDLQQNILSSLETHHQSSERHGNQTQTQLSDFADILKPLSLLMHQLCHGGVQLRTHVALEDGNIPSVTHSTSTNPLSNPSGLITSDPTCSSEDSIIQYQLNGNITTIMELWEEYDKGIIPTPGMPRGPSIRELDDRFGIKWSSKNHYQKHYTRR